MRDTDKFTVEKCNNAWGVDELQKTRKGLDRKFCEKKGKKCHRNQSKAQND